MIAHLTWLCLYVMGKLVAYMIGFTIYVLFESRMFIGLGCCMCAMGKSVAHLISLSACVLQESQLFI